MRRFTGKVAFITGAASGIGRAAAIAFAQEGARVAITDRTEAALDQLRAEIEAEGGEALAIRCDVSVSEDVEAAVAKTAERFGRIDCAFNNAGVENKAAPVHEITLDEWDRILDINLRGTFVCMKHEIAQMLAQEPVNGARGAIVNIASVSSVRPQPGNAAYVAAKHGVIGLTKTGSVEVAPQGIRVNAVMPGAIDTPMLRAALDTTGYREEDFAPALSLLGRFGRPEEVAEASAWLCSDAASYVTGHALAVEAGYLTR